MNLNLQNKTALVCGSTQGIGKAAAMALAGLGARIILCARNAEALESVKNELPQPASAHHTYLVADFSKPETLQRILHTFTEKSGPIHILVNNTGGPAGGPIADAATDAFEQTFRQHLICNHILAQAVIPGMKSSGFGRIINVISTSVKQPLKGLGVSNTIRAAVANWAKTLSVELAPFGITVNNVLPGATLTQRLTTLIANRAKQSGRPEEAIQKEMVTEIPAGRLGQAEDIAAAIAFLASPAAGYINGINLPVDGGRTGCL
ncbi:SDR family oxidoreductase [bacterium]|nr:SDR family oxidoreductase [bacterium]NUN45477.1 SDR family oxidoreductase [bacterium]